MENYTSNFYECTEKVREVIQEFTPSTKCDTVTKKIDYSSLRNKLKEILKSIKTLEDYKTLIVVLENLQSKLSITIMNIFIDLLPDVEKRVWENEIDKVPPFDNIYNTNRDKYNTYSEFAVNIEMDILEWCETNTEYLTHNSKDREFILARNKIYSRFMGNTADIIDG